MDDPSKLENNIYASSINPTLLLQGKNPRLIDEWQLAPKLWDAIRYEVDIRGEEAIEKAIQSLKALANKIDTEKMRSPSFSMVLVGVGKYAYKKEGVYIVPIGCLRE